MPRRALRGLPAAALLLLAACAAPPGESEWDPWQDVNRKTFWFNERVDEYALEPAAEGWEAITTPGVREAVANFGDNLRFPLHFVNGLLQGRPTDAGVATARFAVNTTLGLLGFFDPATPLGLDVRRADFGETFGRWGADEGPYLVLPLFGPSSPRDTAGLAGDAIVLASQLPGGWAVFAVYATVTVNWRAINLDNIREAREASFDYYVAVRSAWLRDRRREIGIMLPAGPPDSARPAPAEEDPYDVDAIIEE
ncbi:MAG: VacJ family lipoprotein [Planctomycetes bacterium]|nr:VacJ family lipoprotein [Planctomycetota bacterium]